MLADHAVLGRVEEVIEQVLVPRRGGGGGECAQPHGEDVHVQKRDLGPVVEGRGQAEGCCFSGKKRGSVIVFVSGVK